LAAFAIRPAKCPYGIFALHQFRSRTIHCQSSLRVQAGRPGDKAGRN